MLRRDVFQAIADPTRRAILVLLATQSLTPGMIADHFESSRQAISKHIKVLAESELVFSDQNGRKIYYELNPVKMQEVDIWLSQFRTLWENRFDKLETLLSKMKNEKNTTNDL